MLDISPGAAFDNLEPNHTLHPRTQPDGNKVLVVVCPFTYPPPEDANHYETPWDVSDGENWMVNCLFCEFLNGGWVDHGCET